MLMYWGLILASVDNLLIANSVADKVLCLLIYTDLNEEIVVKITKLLLGKMWYGLFRWNTVKRNGL